MRSGSASISAPTGEAAKALGAFYTDAQIADFLVWWAVRSRHDTVMDPSFGGGVFLRSACKRLAALGGDAGRQVFGVELDPDVHRSISEKLRDEFGVNTRNLVKSDFFDVDPTPLERVSAIVGNPPFIRYQRFSGDTRRRALARAAEYGVKLSELSSSWAPFVVHCAAMLLPRGRLAMVVPMELGHATYARPVLSFLSRSFAAVTALTFRKKLFPDLSEDTLLLLCDGKGRDFRGLYIRDLDSSGSLKELQRGRSREIDSAEPVNVASLGVGLERLVEYLLPRKARGLYRALRQSDLVARLGDVAAAGIGYVTGANEFFHLGPEEARRWRIPRTFLRPAVRRGRAFAGMRFTKPDWRRALSAGDAAYLLSVDANGRLSKAVQAYLKHGVELGIPRAYKCRKRKPWYRVPNVYEADGFMSYMTGDKPRLVVNLSGAVAPNSLHVIRTRRDAPVGLTEIAVLWHTSLTALSAEIEGHAMGGGMLKLEPKEAERVLLAMPSRTKGLPALASEMDAMMRSGRQAEVQDIADRLVLQDALGLTARDCRALRETSGRLRDRRISRSRIA